MAKHSGSFIKGPSQQTPPAGKPPAGNKSDARDCEYNGYTIPGASLEKRSAGAGGPEQVTLQRSPVATLPTSLVDDHDKG